MTSIADLDSLLDTVASLGAEYNAVTRMLPELARERAAEACERAEEGLPARALEGVPFAVKDVVFIAGYPTSMGSRVNVLGHRQATAGTAEVVTRLMAAGAIPVAKTNCQEFSHGIFGDHSAFGTVVNPAGRTLCTGGSSSGSAALVAAGAVPLAVGTDTAGSVRVPAACQGVVGFKPSFGTVSTEGVFPLAPSFDTVGFLTRTVTDAARAFSAVVDFAGGAPAAVRVGACELAAPHWTDAPTAELLDSPEDVELAPLIDEALTLYETVRSYESYEILAGLVEEQPECFTAGVRERIEQSASVTADAHAEALAGVEQLRQRARDELAGVDVIVTPAIDGGTVPWSELAAARPRFLRYATVFNVLGWPAITVPAGHYPSGAPACLQIAGKPGQDAAVLAAAAELEQRLR